MRGRASPVTGVPGVLVGYEGVMTPSSQPLLDLGTETYVQLPTFRRSGEPVPTPVWVARQDGALVVTTPSGSGKVKRLRHDSRVEVRPCSRFGKVTDDAPAVDGVGRVDTDPQAHEAVAALFRRKYGLSFAVAMVVERVARTVRRSSAGPMRQVVRITVS